MGNAHWRRLTEVLAVRRVGHPGRALSHRRSLSGAVEPQLCPRGSKQRSATTPIASPPGYPRADHDGSLTAFLNPDLSPPERTVAQVEGWILGVPDLILADKRRDDSGASRSLRSERVYITLNNMAKTSKPAPVADRSRRHAVIYARVSSKEQEKEGFSIPAQLKLLKQYASANGFTVAQEYVDVETAKQTGRSAFGEMVAYLKAHPTVRVMLVEKTDRLYRNLRDWVTVDELGVRHG